LNSNKGDYSRVSLFSLLLPVFFVANSVYEMITLALQLGVIGH